MRRRRSNPARLALAAAVAVVFLGLAAAPALAVTVSAKPPTATEGVAIDGTVATFTDGFALLGCPAAGAYSASIDWGDGTTTAGSVSGGVGMLLTGCFYAVAGTHVYAEEGTYDYTVTVNSTSGSGSDPPTPLVVHDAALSASGTSFKASQNTSSAATVATFTDANAGATATDFAAAVAWGDGTSSAGSISAAAGGGFNVTASHAYARTGTFSLSVTITDTGGSQTAAGSAATVLAASGPPPTTPPPGTTTPPPSTVPAALRIGISTPELARGGTVVVGLRCPAAAHQCRGRLSVSTVASPGSRLPALRRAQPLGTTLFIIPGGRRAQLSVRPKQALVAVLRQAGFVKVAAVASSFDSTGRSQVARLTATLRLPRR